MELKGQEGALSYTPIFRESSETLDPRHHGQQNPSPRRQGTDQFNGGGGDRSSSKAAALPAARFRECRKNHAASVGGKVLDGCGEFMPSGEDGTLEALKCAACDCHRNFHRKELDGGGGGGGVDFSRRAMVHPLQLPPPLPSPSLKHHQAANHNHWTPIVQPVKMAFGGGGGGGGGGTDSSSEDLNFNAYQSNAGAVPQPPPFVMSKKRFRTKFTADQKGKMMEYAEKVGWRIPREDDAEVQRFCAEIGVKRQVFKVWMHNNKSSSSMKKQNQQQEGET